MPWPMSTLATTESWKDKQTGEKQERTEWHNVVFYSRLAEIAGEYLKKGSQVYVEGSLRTRKWQDKSGNDRYTTEIVASEMQMLGGRRWQWRICRRRCETPPWRAARHHPPVPLHRILTMISRSAVTVLHPIRPGPAMQAFFLPDRSVGYIAELHGAQGAMEPKVM